jgi:hypothetical protein
LLVFAWLWAAGIIFKVNVEGGTVVLEIEPAGKPLQVSVGGDESFTIIDPNDGERIEVTVDRAEKKLRLHKQGFQIVTESFELASKDGKRIKVTFVPDPVVADPVIADPVIPAEPIEGVLTVAQDGSGQFQSIQEALDHAEAGMTIRVLDDAVYEETLGFQLANHHDLRLESPRRATLRAVRPGNVLTITVPGVQVRGFRFELGKVVGGVNAPVLFCVAGLNCAGSVIEENEFVANSNSLTQGVTVANTRIDRDDPPVIVRNCRFDTVYYGIRLAGLGLDYQSPEECSSAMIVDNRFEACVQAVDAEGDLRDVLIAGNRIVGAFLFGIQLEQMVGEPRNIVIANNTIFRSRWPIRVWDSGVRETRVTVVNNLTLEGDQPDWIFLDCQGDRDNPHGAGDTTALQKAWRFAANHREGKRVVGEDLLSKSWIPPSDADHLHDKIALVSRSPANPRFLELPEDSALRTAGLQDEKLPLPPQVGAAGDPGPPWDWMKTWQAMRAD